MCVGTLKNVCMNKYSGPAIPSDANVLYQIACGLNYIHSKNVLHSRIKPTNISISLSDPLLIKVSNVGSSKSTGYKELVNVETQILKIIDIDSTENWRAPECLQLVKRASGKHSMKSDIFSCGLVFFYFVTRGTHPFGNFLQEKYFNVSMNIKLNQPVNFKREFLAPI